jgi:mycobactin lysine-N-oxygenase
LSKSPQKSSQQTLVAIGAGPKSLAIAAKIHVLKRSGWSVPKLVVIEKDRIASHWLGRSGFTNGSQTLGTPPQKDVGFPYNSLCWGSQNGTVNESMSLFSWQNFLIATNRYSRWVDRGRPSPTHSRWGEYLNWVAKKAGIKVKWATAKEIDIEGRCWKIECASNKTRKTSTITGDGLIITGPGPATKLPGQPEDDTYVMDGRTFWRYENLLKFEHLRKDSAISIGIVGSGETAASIAVTLADLVRSLNPYCHIAIVTSHGAIYSRDEAFTQNVRFTDPTGWAELSVTDRRQFINRTDRGVFSPHALTRLEDLIESKMVEPITGRVTRVSPTEPGVQLTVKYGSRSQRISFDYLISASGFEPLWFEALMTNAAKNRLHRSLGGRGRSAIEKAIDHDLSVKRLMPRLHLPMLAGFAQGPGFPNLSSLGLLSDRILIPYCSEATHRKR